MTDAQKGPGIHGRAIEHEQRADAAQGRIRAPAADDGRAGDGERAAVQDILARPAGTRTRAATLTNGEATGNGHVAARLGEAPRSTRRAQDASVAAPMMNADAAVVDASVLVISTVPPLLPIGCPSDIRATVDLQPPDGRPDPMVPLSVAGGLSDRVRAAVMCSRCSSSSPVPL
jgi:hypothetical protein